MGSRRFFYFLPAGGMPGRRMEMLVELTMAGLVFDRTAIVALFNDQGLVTESRVVPLEQEVLSSLVQLCDQEQVVQVQCQDRRLFFDCIFGSPHPVPIDALVV